MRLVRRSVLNSSWITFPSLIGSEVWTLLLQPKELVFFGLLFPPLQQQQELGSQNVMGKFPAPFANVYDRVWQQMIPFERGHAFQVWSSVRYARPHRSAHFRNGLGDIFFSVRISAVLWLNASCSAFSKPRLRLSTPTNIFRGERVGNLAPMWIFCWFVPPCKSISPKGISHCLE